jgi:hypothetical protein
MASQRTSYSACHADRRYNFILASLFFLMGSVVIASMTFFRFKKYNIIHTGWWRLWTS